jgi:hypothetical protein
MIEFPPKSLLLYPLVPMQPPGYPSHNHPAIYALFKVLPAPLEIMPRSRHSAAVETSVPNFVRR